MSLLYHTGFDYIPLTGSGFLDARGILARVGWVDFASGPAGFAARYEISNVDTPFNYGRYLRINTLVNALSRVSHPFVGQVSRDEVFMGTRIWADYDNYRTLQPYVGFSYNGARVMRVVFSDYGVLRVINVAGTVLYQSPPGTYQPNTWNYVELGFKLTDDPTGWLICKLNGKELVSLVSQVTSMTGNLLANMVTVGYFQEAPVGWISSNTRWDDIYVCDSLGARNNTFLGNVRVQSLLPDGDDTVTWNVEPNTNQNWESVRNTVIDDSTYVYSNVVGDQDKYTIEPMVNTPEVFGIQVTGLYRQDDASQRSVANVIDSGGTEEEGAEYFTPALSYASSIDMFETDPDTGVSWLPPAVNGLLVGPKVKS